MKRIQNIQEEANLNSKQAKQIYNIITGRVQPRYQPIDQSIFNIDLVMRIKLPLEKYKPRDKLVPLSSFVCNPSQNLSKAYTAAYQDLFDEMDIQQEGQIQRNEILMKDFDSYDFLVSPVTKTITIKDGEHENQQQIELVCNDNYNGKLDAFTIKINTLIYILQKKCGFKLRCFMSSQRHSDSVTRQLYIFITQTTENLISVAQRHKIKKQVDYTQIDLFINDPSDTATRPIKINKGIIQLKERKIRQGDHILTSKQIIRRLHGVHQKQVPIINEIELQNKEVHQYLEYEKQNQKIIHKLLNQPIELSRQEKIYLYEFNRHKINPGVEKQYKTIKKKRIYYKQMEQLATKAGYKVHIPQVIYSQFMLASKKMKFFDRVRSLLLFKQKIISPFGDLSLFVKAERIKVCYLALKQYIRVQNLNKLNCEVFALNDNFDKYGKQSQIIDRRPKKPEIRGGLDGKNLVQEWSGAWPWKVNIIALIDYLGQAAAFQIFLKSHLILHFLAVTPIGIAGEIFSRLYIKPQNQLGFYQPQFYFILFYYLILMVIYNVFLQLWNQKQHGFNNNYVEKQISHNFLYSYNGPFIRNPITDGVNQYQLNSSFYSKLKQLIFFGIIGIILGIQVAFFFGIRQLIVALDSIFNSSVYYIISPAHILPYGLFFIANYANYNYLMKPFIQWLTLKENISTQYAFKSSLADKTFFFLIGLQLIGPIDLLLIEPFNRTDCFARNCYQQFQFYTYSRYMVIFFFVLIKIVRYLFKYFTTNKIEIQFINQQKYEISNYYTKFYSLMKFVEQQSNKEQLQLSIVDQTIALFHHGIFMASFPLSAVFSMLNMALQYFLERLEILHNKRRPIGKPQKLINYSEKYYLVMHLSFFINCWIIFYSLEQIQYAFPQIIQAFETVPTAQGIITVKILATVLFIIIFEVIAAITRVLVIQFSGSSIRQRQHNKRDQFLRHKMQNTTKLVTEVQHSYPLRTISRVYHLHPTVIRKRIQSEMNRTYRTIKSQPQNDLKGSNILRNMLGFKKDKKKQLNRQNQQASKSKDKNEIKNIQKFPL